MNKKIILLVAAFILLPMVTAADSSFIFEQNKPAGISVPVHNNDLSSCDTCSCYLTVKAPNGSVILSEQPMAIDGGYAKHTLSENYTAELGTHECRIKCSNGADNGFTTFSFEVTPSGSKIDSGQGFTSLGLIIAALAGAFLFMLFSFKFSESDSLFPISLMFMILSILLAVYSIYLGYIYSEAILYTIPVAKGQSAIFQGVLWSMVTLIFIGMVWLTVKIIKMYNIKKLKKQYGPDFDTDKLSYES